jgi:RND family efflux transporter MFP subunit
MESRKLLSRLVRIAVAALVLVAMAVLVMALSGVFAEKIEPTQEPSVQGRSLPPGTATLVLAPTEVRVVEEAVGTVRAVQEIQLASRILATIRTMHVAGAGQVVTAGEILVELSDDDLRARLLEAQAAQRSAEETRQQAERDLARTRELFDKQIASANELDRDRTRYENAAAELERSTQATAAAQTMLDYAVIRSPIDGVVIDKVREKGDTVAPGQLLMTLYDPTRMQLVASVREQLATRLELGESVEVAIDALDLRCHGEVSEIVPRAEAGSRTFDVKVTGPCPEGIFTGMFGRLLVDLGTREEIRIPATAVRRFGQVDQVDVVEGFAEGATGADAARLLRRMVVLGEADGDQLPVLSGLRAGERIVVDARALRGTEPR